ncbi:SIMPL domain-containing protein [bacterium]|nr:SIMPL domain-containing protein [bacterium]
MMLGLGAVAIALVVMAFVVAGAIVKVKRAGDTITVTGSATRPITSDHITWRGNLSADGSTLPAAYAEMTRMTERVRLYLKDHGVKDDELTFGSLSTQTLHEVLEDGRHGRVVGHRLTQPFAVEGGRVEEITRLSRESTELLAEGIPLVSWNPEYIYTKLDELRVDMMAEATVNARMRAERIAESAGSKIGAVRNARQGVFQITARNSTEVSDYGISDTSALEKDITAVVRVTFAIE